MEEHHEEGKSLLDRKRPVVEGLIEDILGPASQLDEFISRHPLPEGVNLVEENSLERPKDQKS